MDAMDIFAPAGIRLVPVVHEQGAGHMAEGYARACGRPGVVLVTSGPGATNTVTPLQDALMDGTPIVVFCGQVATGVIGTDAFQEADIFGITMPVVKHSYLVKAANDIPRIVREAFHISTTGRPGPVLIDIPKDISAGPCTADLHAEMDIPGYTLDSTVDNNIILEIAEALAKSKRPLILAGHGAMISRADDALLAFAEKAQIPVTSTLLGKGVFPETHALALGMLYFRLKEIL